MEPLEFAIPINDFDLELLPDDSRAVGSEAFQIAVAAFYVDQFRPLGGNVYVGVDSEKINVSWVPQEVFEDPKKYVYQLLSKGDYGKAIPLLEVFIAGDSKDAESLYNLGMVFSDQGRLEESLELLDRASVLEPESSGIAVAQGVAFQRSGQVKDAIRALERALKIAPNDAYAHRNLGAILGTAGNPSQAIEHLQRATQLLPEDQASWYGLGRALINSEDPENLAEADEALMEAIRLSPNSQIGELAKEARSEIAAKNFRSADSGPRMDAVMYCLGAIEKFEKLSRNEVQTVTFEIAMLGRSGLDVNDSEQKYSLRSMPGKFSGLHLVSIMYVGFKILEPTLDSGFDLSKEYEAAKMLHKSSPK